MKNTDKYMTYKEAENAFLTNCYGIPATMASMIPWEKWDNDMRNRYKAWLFEDNESQSKTFSGTTVYWSNPPRKDDAALNNSAEDYDKIVKEVVDAWFDQHESKKPHLNKDRFDDYNSAWLCFEYECEYGDEKSAEIYFSRWLFYPYNPSIIKAWKNGCK